MRYIQSRFSVALALLAALAMMPAAVEAQVVYCNLGTVTSPQWAACSGAWSGNDSGAFLSNTLTLIKEEDTWTGAKGYVSDQDEFGIAFSNVQLWTIDNYVGTTDGYKLDKDGQSILGADQLGGPFDPFPETWLAGTLFLKNPFIGTFVIILKSANSFQMFLGHATSSVTEVVFSMQDTQLSHASLWLHEEVSVPEPSSLLLLGSGLLGMGFVGYRRRRK